MEKEQLIYLKLVGSIERWMESGEPVLSLGYLLAACENREDFLNDNLKRWDSEGRIEWLKPLNTKNLTEDVVRFKTYISVDLPWRR